MLFPEVDPVVDMLIVISAVAIVVVVDELEKPDELKKLEELEELIGNAFVVPDVKFQLNDPNP